MMDKLREELLAVEEDRNHYGLQTAFIDSSLTVDRCSKLDTMTPSLHSHYRSFNTTTGYSAPILRIGTLTLTVSAAWISPLGQKGLSPLSPPPPLRQCRTATPRHRCRRALPGIHLCPPNHGGHR